MSVISQVRAAATQALQSASPRPAASKAESSEFRRMLQARLGEQQISITAHAADRMIRRGIVPDAGAMAQLQSAFDMAAQKGAREALFLLDDMAIIASVPDRTVKTALDRAALDAGVFTNIDAAVVLSSTPGVSLESEESTVNLSPRSSRWAPSGEAAIQPGGMPL